MKQAIVRPTRAVICVAVALLAGIGALVWHQGAESSAEAAVLSAIPHGQGDSLSDQAVTRWAGKVKQNAENDAAWANLGEALMQKARETGGGAYYKHAETAFRKALSLNPKNVPATVGISWVYGSLHEFEQSIEWARKAVALEPKNQDAYGLLGDAVVEMGDYDQAFQHYQKMLDIRPDLSSYSRAAHLLQLSGDTRKASWLIQKAIAAGGPYAENAAWCRAQRALMLWGTGAVLAAEQEAKAAFEQAPNNYQVLTAMGKIKTARSEYQSAIEYYQKAAKMAPHPETIIALGDLYRLKGQNDEAEKQYALVEAIFKASGRKPDIQRARFYADHDRNLPEALKEAEAVYAQRKNVFVSDTLAWCYYKNGRYEEARKAILEALKMRTPDASFLFHAGMIHARLGVRSEAQRYLYQALSLNPHFHPVDAVTASDVLKQLGSSPSS